MCINSWLKERWRAGWRGSLSPDVLTDADERLIIGVDFHGEDVPIRQAEVDLWLTLARPSEVMDAAESLARRGLMPAAWRVFGVASLPGGVSRGARFAVSLAVRGRAKVCVSAGEGSRTARRLTADVHCLTRLAEKQGLSPRVQVLCCRRERRPHARLNLSLDSTKP